MTTAPRHLVGVGEQTRRRSTRLVATAALLALTTLACTPDQGDAAATSAGAPAHAPTADEPGPDRTSPAEARRVDRVPTPDLHWTACQKIFQCAAAQLPLDYDDPHGATIKVALLRLKAKDPSRRIGSLFLNPGGPGDPATDYVAENAPFFPAFVRDRFDIVGIDPRGVGLSRQIRCFSSKAEQSVTTGSLSVSSLPVTPADQRTWIADAQAFGRACSTTAGRIASAMSTTEDARDMDVLRRAVGDNKLSYLAQSFGSYLGEVYANMFPDRVRAVAIDGIVDPEELVGTPATAQVPVFLRLGSDAASYRALHALLERCQQVGQSQCSFADADTQARFDHLAERLRGRPLRLAAPRTTATTYTYANFIFDTEQWLHDPSGYKGLFADLTDLERLTAPGGAGSGQEAIVRGFLARHPARPTVPGYDNGLEALEGKACTDGLSGADAASWPAAADHHAKYFGEYYAWITVECARDTWTAQDEDVYRGPFDRRTAAPVLVVGAKWDPATRYENAVKVARLMPNSRLVSSDNWGHQSLTTSACVDNSVFDYLVDPLASAPKVTYCHGDVQPFAAPSAP